MANYDYIILSNLGIQQTPASRRFLQAGVINAQPAATTLTLQPAATTATIAPTINAQPVATITNTVVSGAQPAALTVQPAATIAQPAAVIAQPTTTIAATPLLQTQLVASDPTLQDPIATSVNTVKLNPQGISVDGSTPQSAANTQTLLTSLSTAGGNLQQQAAQGGQQAFNLGVVSTLVDANAGAAQPVLPIASGTIVFNPGNIPYHISAGYLSYSYLFLILAVILI